MRNVLVSYEVSVTQEKDFAEFRTSKPDYIFTCEGDLDVDTSFSDMCKTEYKVQCLCKALKDLGCKVICIRKEISHLDIG